MKARGEAWGSRLPKLRALIEQTAKNFARHDTAVYSMALAYRGLFALLPFALILLAALSFLRADAFLLWLAGLWGRRGCGVLCRA